jgi:hypothetical protein
MVSIVRDVFRELYTEGYAVCETHAVKRLKACGKFEAQQLEALAAFLIRRVARAQQLPGAGV